MSLRINTNIAALNAHKNMVKNDNALSASLERLSSGLRINKAADDSSGMAIADSLRSQGLGLGQAIKNANDGISMVQTADGALGEAIKIIDSIKTKSIQAAQDGQTTDSRNAIQSDISKLMQELNDIAKTTSFNGQKLLSGNFTNKSFQVGAYTGETVGVSIGSSEANKIGHVTTADLQASGVGVTRMSIFSNTLNQKVSIQSITLAYDNTAQNSMGALSDAINKVSDITGVTAQSNVSVSSTSAVAAGSTGSDFSINGVAIGQVTVLANDSDGSLVNAINQKTSQHGIVASTSADGTLTLSSSDGRAIQVSGDTGTTLTGSNLSTLGSIKLFQTGANQILTSDSADNVSLNLTNSLASKAAISTTVDSTLTKDTTIGSGSVFQAGSTVGVTTDGIKGNITTTQDSTLLGGTVLASSSIIAKNSILGGDLNIQNNVTTTGDSLLKTGSSVASATVLKSGTVVTTAFDGTDGSHAVGSTLQSDVTVSVAFSLTADLTAKSGSIISDQSSVKTGSYLGANATVSNSLTITNTMTLKSGSTIVASGTNGIIAAGSTIGGSFTTSDTGALTLSRDMTVKAGSTIGAGTTVLAQGSTIGGNITVSSADVTIASAMTLAAGSQLAAGTVLKQGTVLTNDVVVAGGNILKAGTTLSGDATTQGTNYLGNSMTLVTDSVLNSGSVLAATASSSSGATATTSLSDVQRYKLSDINVTTQDGAQIAISVADSALKNLDKIRSDLGSVQNQLTSTISNISTTQVNIFSAESSIRDVDFASESSTFSKMKILVQASSFAMAQANASGKAVLSLLQG